MNLRTKQGQEGQIIFVDLEFPPGWSPQDDLTVAGQVEGEQEQAQALQSETETEASPIEKLIYKELFRLLDELPPGKETLQSSAVATDAGEEQSESEGPKVKGLIFYGAKQALQSESETEASPIENLIFKELFRLLRASPLEEEPLQSEVPDLQPKGEKLYPAEKAEGDGGAAERKAKEKKTPGLFIVLQERRVAALEKRLDEVFDPGLVGFLREQIEALRSEKLESSSIEPGDDTSPEIDAAEKRLEEARVAAKQRNDTLNELDAAISVLAVLKEAGQRQ